jgi:hypothetical protein
MTSRAEPARLRSVAEPQLRTFALVVDTVSEPIRGRLEDENAFGRDFVGWLGLATALEALLSARAPGSDGPATEVEDA